MTFILQYLFLDYPIRANISQSNRGFPRLFHKGRCYGVKNKSRNSKLLQWRCTQSIKDPVNADFGKQCKGTVRTKVINGYTMMRIDNPDHHC